MNRAMYEAACGMANEQVNLDTIAANLANADVTAFKTQLAQNSSASENGAAFAATPAGARPVFSQGKIEKSGGPCDLAIRGDGFFELERGTERAYTRDGAFSRAADGRLVTDTGFALRGVRVPHDALRLRVDGNGNVSIDTAREHDRHIAIVRLAQFRNPDRLTAIGPTLFTASPQSGPAIVEKLGDEGGPSIAFGMLEHSNVSIIDAMMGILASQRAYEADAKGVQAADETIRLANNLERS